MTIRWVRRMWWSMVTVVSVFTLLFLFGPGCVQRWQVNAIYSVLQKAGL